MNGDGTKMKLFSVIKTNDMTKGSVIRHLIIFSIPLLIGNIFQQLYNMVDSIIVGKFVGSNALAAIGVTGALGFLFFSLCFGMAGGVGVLVSQYFGAGNKTYVKRTIFNSMVLFLVTGILVGVLGVVFSRPLLVLLNTPSAILEEAVIYMQIVTGALVVVSLYNGVSSILRALGDSQSPLFFLIGACLLNVVLDLIFVLVLHMGVAGAAIATIISQTAAFACSMLYAMKTNQYFRLEKADCKMDTKIIQQCVVIGVPMAAQSMLIAFSLVVIQSVVNRYGENLVAAFTATGRVEQIIHQPYASLSMALSTLTAQNMGAGKIDRVKEGFQKSVWVVVVFGLIMFVAIFIGKDFIMRLFVSEPEVIRIGKVGLIINAVLYIPLGFIYTTRGMLNGAGDIFYTYINGVVEVVVRISLSMLLVLIPLIDYWGVWYATGLTWVFAGLVGIIRYKKGKWKSKSLISSDE